MGSPFVVRPERSPVLATAIHAGHELRDAIAVRTALDDAARLREEDPFTDLLIPDACTSVVVRRSRFELDLNRPRERAIYRRPEDAWGLDLWTSEPTDAEVAASLALYDEFYARLGEDLDARARAGPFVLLDLHSYNHRRDGDAAAPADPEQNPEVNIGTGSIDRGSWGTVVDDLMSDLGGRSVAGHRLDVRENVKFTGGQLSRWVNERYGDRGCAIAIEFKKVFMDEWTGEPDRAHVQQLATAVASTASSLVAQLEGRR